MNKLSRTSLAKAFVRLLDDHKQTDLVAALAHQLVISRRVSEADLIVKDIARELLRQKKHLELAIATAHPLSLALLKLIEEAMQQEYKAQTVSSQTRHDPLLLGGMVVETPEGSRDLSIRHKLERLQTNG